MWIKCKIGYIERSISNTTKDFGLESLETVGLDIWLNPIFPYKVISVWVICCRLSFIVKGYFESSVKNREGSVNRLLIIFHRLV